MMMEKLEYRKFLAAVSVGVNGGVMTVTGGSKADNITVTEFGGNVTVFNGVTGATFIASGIHAISINGKGGNDQIFYTGDSVGAVIHGDSGNDSLTVDDEGTGSSNAIGDSGDDSIVVLHGNQTSVAGSDGNDTIYLNTAFTGGSTVASGGAGNDVITIYDGTNNVTGDNGNDVFITFGGINTLSGNGGNDSLVDAGGTNTFTT
jgi:3-phytase